MTHLKTYELFNVQDIMSIPTSITGGNVYIKTPKNEYITTLQPYYDYIKTLTTIKDLSDIIYEKIENYVGFSFILLYMKIMILSDKKNVHILINDSLIPLDNTDEILKIIESEK